MNHDTRYRHYKKGPESRLTWLPNGYMILAKGEGDKFFENYGYPAILLLHDAGENGNLQEAEVLACAHPTDRDHDKGVNVEQVSGEFMSGILRHKDQTFTGDDLKILEGKIQQFLLDCTEAKA